MRRLFPFLDRIGPRLLLVVGVLVGTFSLFLLLLGQEVWENTLREREEDVRRLTEIARKALAPTLLAVRLGEIPPQEGHRRAVEMVKQFTYQDVHGPNYFLLLDYDGVLWVNPFLPEREGTPQLDLVDPRGFPVVREMLRIAREEGEGWVSYLYPPPDSTVPERKISYVAALPEIRCLIGTGTYVADQERALAGFLRNVLLVGALFLLLGLLVSHRLLRPLVRSYASLLTSMKQLAENPSAPPQISLEGLKEGTEAWSLLTAFLDMDRRLREAGAQLQRDEERLRLLVEEAPDGLMELDGSYRVAEVNRSFCDLTGFLREDLVGRRVADLFAPGELEQQPLRFDEVLLGAVVTRRRKFQRADGTAVPAETRTKRLSDGTLLSLIRDLSEREAAQTRLQEQQSLLESLFRNVPFELWVRDREGRILLQNERCRRGQGNLAGQRVEEHPGMSPEQRRLWQETNRQAYEGQTLQYEEEETREGRKVWLHKVIAPIWVDGEVRGILGAHLDVTEQRLREREVEHLAFYDPLTDLPNLRHFTAHMEERLAEARAGRGRGALLFLDLDDFKLVNDSLGHALGDRFLVEVANRLRSVLGPGRMAARLGGDEFLLLSAPEEGCREVEAFAQELLDLFETPFEQEGTRQFLTVTVGVACFPEDSLYPESLLAQADMALHKAKREGKRCFRFYDAALQEEVVQGRELENQLREALDRGELSIFLQPQMGVLSGQVEALECLARWDSPTLGSVPPGRFIPVAERSGLILPLGLFVLREACRFAASLEPAGLPPLRVAVNVSARQLLQEDFAETTLRILEEEGLDPSRLEVEITETLLMEAYDRVSEKLLRLREKGVRVALDDFGMGYSSLTYLRRLPLDTLKIDRSFIIDSRREGNRVITRAMVHLGHDLGLEVVAEGVETEEHRSFVQEAGCDVIQGYWFSRPLPPEEIRSFLRQQGV